MSESPVELGLSAEARVLLDTLPDGVAVYAGDLHACYVNRVWSERRLIKSVQSVPSAAESAAEPAFNAPPQPALAAALARARAGALEASAVIERTRPGLQPE